MFKEKGVKIDKNEGIFFLTEFSIWLLVVY